MQRLPQWTAAAGGLIADIPADALGAQALPGPAMCSCCCNYVHKLHLKITGGPCPHAALTLPLLLPGPTLVQAAVAAGLDPELGNPTYRKPKTAILNFVR